MSSSTGLLARAAHFISHLFGSTVHPKMHYSKKTEWFIFHASLSIQIVACLFGHTPYTLMYMSVCCAAMLWVAIWDKVCREREKSCYISSGAEEKSEREKVLERALEGNIAQLKTNIGQIEALVNATMDERAREKVVGMVENIHKNITTFQEECQRTANTIRELRVKKEKVDALYLDAYIKKIEAYSLDAKKSADRIKNYIAACGCNNGQAPSVTAPGLSLYTKQEAGGALSGGGYLESYSGQWIELAESVRGLNTVRTEEESRLGGENAGAQVIQLGSIPIIIQGLASHGMFIRQVDNGVQISAQPLGPTAQLGSHL